LPSLDQNIGADEAMDALTEEVAMLLYGLVHHPDQPENPGKLRLRDAVERIDLEPPL
jgi:hypothetical protein